MRSHLRRTCLETGFQKIGGNVTGRLVTFVPQPQAGRLAFSSTAAG